MATTKKTKKSKKQKFSCWHAHDYSSIELNGKPYLEITNCEAEDEDPESQAEWQNTVDKVEHIVKLLNKGE